MSPLPRLMFGLIGQWLMGLFVARYLLDEIRRSDADNRPPFIEQAGLGIVLGIGLTAWVLFLWSLFGGMLGSIPSWTLCGIGYLMSVPMILAWIGRRRGLTSEEMSAEQIRRTPFCRVCQCVVGFLIAVAVVESLLTPQRLWDERAIFATKSAVLFEDRTIHSRDLNERDFVQGHPAYPLLIPLAEQHIYALLGHVDDRLSKIVFPLLYAGLVLTVVGVLSRHASASHAWFYGVLLATIPALMPDDYGFLSGQADAPIGCYHSVAVLYVWDALQRLGRTPHSLKPSAWSILIAGLCGGLAAFTKDEGIAFLMVDSAVLALFAMVWFWGPTCPRNDDCMSSQENLVRASATSFSRNLLNPLVIAALIFVASAALIQAPWRIHRRALPADSEMNYFARMTVTLLAERLGTLTWSVPHLGQRLFWEWRDWGLQWWLMLTAAVLFPRRLFHFSQLFLLLDVLGALVALLVAGMLAPVRLEEHIGGSSHRFLMQIAPVAVLFIAGQLAPRDAHRVSNAPATQDLQP